MPIGNVVPRRGQGIIIYDEKGKQVCCLSSGDEPNYGLRGYTSGSVNIQRQGLIYMYNEKGQHINTVSGG
jgi:hypothetical protein